MKFGEKLNFLMNITNTSNSRLSKSVSIDASYISRLRSSLRNMPKNKDNIELFSSFFAQNLDEDYQKTALCELLLIEIAKFPSTKEDLEALIYSWFMETKTKSDSIDDFLLNLSKFDFKNKLNDFNIDFLKSQYITKANTLNLATFNGIKGRQNATLLFLSYVLNNKNSQMIYLINEDNLEWVTSNPTFLQAISNLLSQAIRQGNKIKIIHTIRKNFYDMLLMIDAWMPLYISGAIEPFYYPKPKDSLIKRTLFLAPDTAAVVSTTIGDNVNASSNFLFTEKNVISEFLSEYNNYLSFCHPLIKIFTPDRSDEYLDLLTFFESKSSKGIIKSNTISSFTMTQELIKSIFDKLDFEKKEELYLTQLKRIRVFKKYIEKNVFTEIITLPDINDIIQNKTKIYFCNPFLSQEIYYTPSEFLIHLKQITKLLKSFDNYNIYIEPNDTMKDCVIFIKQDVGMMFSKMTYPYFLCLLEEPSLTGSFWDYMYIKTNPFEDIMKKKQQSITKLKSYIKQLSKYI